MSLLDDVSIVVTPNGYKAGTLYGVLPTYTEGSEEVTNGDFEGVADGTDVTTLSGWGAYGSPTSRNVVDNKLVIVATGGNQGAKYTTSSLSGTCKLSVDVSGDVGSGGIYISNPATNITTSVGKLEYYFVGSGVTDIFFRAGSNSAGTTSYTNISVKEYTASDMDVTRATAATRVDENGLVNYAEVLGSEEVSCGTFDCANPDAVWSRGTGWTISGGNAVLTSSSGILDQTLSGVIVGQSYKLSWETDLNFQVRLGGASIGYFSGNNSLIISSAAGGYLEFLPNGTQTGTLDNVSLKQIDRNNVPRIDYTGGGCPHILVEPERTNLIPYSEDLTQGSTNRLTVDPNVTTAPDGTNTADKLIPTVAGSSYHYFAINSLSINSNYRYSVYLKKSEYEYALINFETLGTGASSKNAIINLNNGNIESTNFTSVSVTSEGNGWYRCSVQATASRTSIAIYPLPTSGTGSFAGDGTSGIFAWGIQLEEGSYETSYIPTSGSTVTRNQDLFTRDGIGSLINSTEGVLFFEGGILSDDGTTQIISLFESTSSRVSLTFSSTLNRIQFYVAINGFTNTVTINAEGFTKTDINKIALRYGANNYALFINGVKEGENTAQGNTFTVGSLTELTLSNTLPFFGKVKQVQVYDTALTDMQLIQLTGTSGTDFYESYSEMAESLTYTIQ